MVRVGGLGYKLNPAAPSGQRVEGLVKWPSGEPIQAQQTYAVAGWASVNEGAEGPAIYDVVSDYISEQQSIVATPNQAVSLVS